MVMIWLAQSAVLAQQQTRAASIVEAQAAKAQRLEPYVPGKAERIAVNLKKHFFESPEGFYPWFDSVYSGGGFTAGAGYRNFYGDRTFWNARGLYSIKAYKLAELTTESLGLAQGRVDLRAAGGFRDATQVAFYGVGHETDPDARSNFRLKQAYVAGAFRGRGPGPFFVDFSLAYEDFRLEGGTATTSPSIESMYTPATAPGLGDSPEFVHIAWTGGIDSRPSPDYARRGGLYAIAYDSYYDPDHTYTFDRLQAEVVQHVPILRENWVVSLHGVARATLDEDYTVPYFLLSALGSGSTLRAYPSWRFRDRHSLLVSGEWRWIPSRLFLDMAIFYDAGKVAGRLEDLNFKDLKHDAGVGVRFHGPLTTPLRVDVAKGSEGLNVVFSGSAAF
jgi:hypothetical protein